MLRLFAFSLLAAAVLPAPEKPAAPPASAPAAAPATSTVSPAPASAPAVAAAPAIAAAPVAKPVAPAAAKQTAKVTFTQCYVDGPFIAITFDDGPNAATTPRLLKMLKERDIKATFFLVGQCVAAEPEVARQIVAEGHELANHSWSHPQLTKIGEGSVRDQLQRTHDVIKQETGVSVTLMRPPFGAFTVGQRNWAYGTWGYQCILWDVDSLDWKHRSPAKTQSIILSETRAGSIILCHDIHKTTVDAMPATLDALKAKGFKFVTVSDLIKMDKGKPTGPAAKPAPVAKTLTAAEAADAPTTLEEIAQPPKVTIAKTPSEKHPAAEKHPTTAKTPAAKGKKQK